MTVERPSQARADLAAIFVGGEGRRMGGVDKATLMFGGRPLWRVVAHRLAPQAHSIAALAPSAPAWLPQLPGARWIADAPEAQGPAAGLLAALRFLGAVRGADALLLTAPVDSPFLPEDLFARLEAARGDAPAAIVRHAGGLHPVFGVWRAGSAALVAAAAKEDSALHVIAERAGAVECAGWAGLALDAFTNINTPEDLAAAEQVRGG